MSEHEEYVTYADRWELGLDEEALLRKIQECADSGHDWDLENAYLDDSEYFFLVMECRNCYAKYENNFHHEILSKYVPSYADIDRAKKQLGV